MCPEILPSRLRCGNSPVGIVATCLISSKSITETKLAPLNETKQSCPFTPVLAQYGIRSTSIVARTSLRSSVETIDTVSSMVPASQSLVPSPDIARPWCALACGYSLSSA